VPAAFGEASSDCEMEQIPELAIDGPMILSATGLLAESFVQFLNALKTKELVL
jgi:hypothetical protein